MHENDYKMREIDEFYFGNEPEEVNVFEFVLGCLVALIISFAFAWVLIPKEAGMVIDLTH